MNTSLQKDWTQFVPKNQDLQYSAPTGTDAYDCNQEAISHIIYCLTGFQPSPRALAKLAGTTQQGSDTMMSFSAINNVMGGLIPFQLWPNPASFNWDSFYEEIPQSAKDFLLPAIISIQPVDLSKSPSLTRLMFPSGVAHFVCQINSHQYYDSEPGGAIKELSYGGAVATSSVGIGITDNFFLKSVGFTPAQFANLPVDVQVAIHLNDQGGKNVILGTKILTQE